MLLSAPKIREEKKHGLSCCNCFQLSDIIVACVRRLTWPTVLVKSPSADLIMSEMSFSPIRSVNPGKKKLPCAKPLTWHVAVRLKIYLEQSVTHGDLVHYIKRWGKKNNNKKPSQCVRQWDSVLPPCQLDRSLPHTERWRWMEVVELLAEGWCLPHIIQRRCSRRGLLDVPTTRRWHSAGRDIWYVYKQWALMPRPLLPLTVLCGSHTLCGGAAGGRRRGGERTFLT